MPASRSARSLSRILVLLLFVYSLVILNWRLEILRFKFDPLNYFFFLAILSLPVPALVIGLRFPRLWMKAVSVVCTLPLLLCSAYLAFLTVLVIPNVVKNGEPALWHRVRTVPSSYYNLVVYYHDYLVIVRQEKTILPGILLVRQVYLAPDTDIELDVLDKDSIKVASTIDPASKGGTVLHLKRFVYF
jgi:hypothetical protein